MKVLSAVLTTILLPAAVLAQPAPSPSEAARAAVAEAEAGAAAGSVLPDTSVSTVVSPLVVQGRSKAALQAFARTVDTFVKAQGKPGPIGQISRWHGPVCPATEGLTPGLNAFVSARIKAIASRVGAPAGGCSAAAPNVKVIFTPEPEALMVDVRDNHPNLLGFHYRDEVRSLAVFEPPMKSWYVTASRFTAKLTGAQIDAMEQGLTDSPGSPLITKEGTGTHVRIDRASDMAYVLVVVDARRVEGFTIGAVADEVAMVALSRPRGRDGCSPLPSIMDALNPECSKGDPIEGLTRYDESYLKALYGYRGSEIMVFENSAIAKAVIKTTAPPSPAGRTQAKGKSCDQSGSHITAC
jgi:hypothetical protein